MTWQVYDSFKNPNQADAVTVRAPLQLQLRRTSPDTILSTTTCIASNDQRPPTSRTCQASCISDVEGKLSPTLTTRTYIQPFAHSWFHPAAAPEPMPPGQGALRCPRRTDYAALSLVIDAALLIDDCVQ
jgi:hypothetical protein